MSSFTVNLVTAFGRGETLALALHDQGFTVRVLDFTGAFPAEYSRGPGPFPIAMKAFLAQQKEFLSEAVPLPRGLAFWLADGPLELDGSLAPFFKSTRSDFHALASGIPAADFKTDWLRRFLAQWASPIQVESWAPTAAKVSQDKGFPWTEGLGVIPSYDEISAMSFERFRSKGHSVVACQRVEDVQFEGARLREIAVEAGQAMAYAADQWVWWLSSRETEILNSGLAGRIFTRGVWRPDWSWISFPVQCEHGPWVGGFPAHTVVIGDVCLPWLYANLAVLRRLESDGFRVWMKVPAKAIGDEDQRRRWTLDLEALLNGRLGLAKWAVDAAEFKVCPHSPVFDGTHREWGVPGWKNWDWIAPETLARLDFSARLEREAQSFERLVQWRNDQLKKQGAPRDSTLHAP